MIRESFEKYRETSDEDRRVLLDRYRLVDAAIKVVGIGSVGTLCMVALMMSVADNPLFLQFKQANASVLEAYAGKSTYPNHGQRVVMGQRLMQPASDLFLGWVIGPEGRHFYIRQLRDVKLSPLVETYDAAMLSIYGELCGWALARAREGRRPLGDQRISRQKERPVRPGDGQVCARLCRAGRARPRSVAGCRSRRCRRGPAGALSSAVPQSNDEANSGPPCRRSALERPVFGTDGGAGERHRH